ncbi:RluA family pseudouridine synthase [Blastopirellula retiformator]|uniref:Pseudouridine synthase n=1 Tax=Blastopirellula retiformator TaxID=2527970 RepID=A0A5C5VK54_9BACT|nr:Ribosomal large subunit pseudouridine synthase A [Blastopirellula retiformator]
MPRAWKVLHLDEQLIVLDKPSGLLSVPGRGDDKYDSLAVQVAADYPGARNVHRLDRDTSGVIVMAFDAETHRQLSRQFEQRETSKRYVAIVAGQVADDSGRIELPLRKDFDHPPRHMVDPELGKPAITDWQIETWLKDATRLALIPQTGRSHQLRVHLQAIGHPILGDPLYSPPEIKAAAPRLMLHAQELEITHPASGKRMRFTAPAPF